MASRHLVLSPCLTGSVRCAALPQASVQESTAQGGGELCLTEVLELMGSWIALTFGAVVGSFCNVCIYRLPRRESIISPPSHCPYCGMSVRWHDNVPIVGYILLKGRCRDCGHRIGARYPVVESTVALLYLGLWWLNGGQVWLFLADAAFATALVICVGIDLEHRLLPDRVTLPLLGFGLMISLIPGDLSPLASLIGALAGGGIMYGIAVLGDAVYKRETMGGGDIKLTAAIGAFLGWRVLIVALFAAFVLGAIGGLIYLAFGGKEKTVPFGPFLAMGALIAIVAGQQIWTWYTGFLR